MDGRERAKMEHETREWARNAQMWQRTAGERAEEIRALRARVAELEAVPGLVTAAHALAMAERRGAESMRERAAAVLDGMAALDDERAAEDARLGDERGAVFWRGRATRWRTVAARVRALPLTDATESEER